MKYKTTTGSVSMKPATQSNIVMIHGFRGTHHGLAKIVEKLDSSYICHVPDIPGFGDGERNNNLSIDGYIDWLERYISSLKLEKPPILLGHSFGSIITSYYAARHPERIRKLILVNPIGAPALEGSRKILTKLAVFYYWLSAKLPKRLAHVLLSSQAIVMIMSIAMTKTKNKTLRNWIHAQHRTYFSRFHNPDSVLAAFRTSVEYSVRDVASSITTPTLLIAGERDDITPLNKQALLQALFPNKNASLVVIPKVGHLTHYETPQEVTDAIKRFAC